MSPVGSVGDYYSGAPVLRSPQLKEALICINAGSHAAGSYRQDGVGATKIIPLRAHLKGANQ
jgi:hypothetical protein